MPRRARKIKKETTPDARYHNITVAKLVNRIMQCGKQRTAERIVYDALALLEKQTSKDPVTALEQAIKNATPLLEVKHVGLVALPIRCRWKSDLTVASSWP